MKKNCKRILLALMLAGIVVLAAVAGWRYIPWTRILKVHPAPENEFVSNQQVPSRAPHTLFVDFEVDPKTGNTKGLYKGIAHSGQYSAKAFGKNSYAIAIERKAEEIGLDNLDAVGLSCWVYVFPTSTEVQGAFVFTINNDLGVNICWKGVSLSGKEVPQGEWLKISGLFDISDIKIKPGYKIQIYFWNNSSTDILADDYHVVFGGQKPRRGDSTYVDMTKGELFVPRINFPPFPTILLEKEEIGNGNSSSLVSKENKKEEELTAMDFFYTGNFTGNPDGLDEIMVFSDDGKNSLYRYCKDNSRFVRVSMTIPPALAFLGNLKVITGNFTNLTASQFLALKDGKLILAGIEKQTDLCKTTSTQTNRIVFLSETALSGIPGLPDGEKTWLAGDIDGDGFTELVCINSRGSWSILKSSGITISSKILASGTVSQWACDPGSARFTAGYFTSKTKQQQILSVIKTKERQYKYSLFEFNPLTGKFVSLYPARLEFSGKTIGLDTLKPGDNFFSGVFDRSGKARVFRYNRDWRYDLKEISFEDEYFRILSNVDCTGYPNDCNPKYFEKLILLPGKFIEPGINSFLVIGTNYDHKDPLKSTIKPVDLPELPNAVQLYSFR